MSERLRLVVMGDPFVGKSSIVKRFLFGNFNEKYTPTVEDLYSQDYDLGGGGSNTNSSSNFFSSNSSGAACLKVDILDTSGDSQFPAMRRLSIASAHSFLMVYSVTDPTSFQSVKLRCEEIRKQRKDFQDIPIVIAGNKTDLVREVDERDVKHWCAADMFYDRVKLVDCSAQENINIIEIFKSFLTLSRIENIIGTKAVNSISPLRKNAPVNLCADDTPGQMGRLKRNLSAYGRLKSQRKQKPPNSSNGNSANTTPRHDPNKRDSKGSVSSPVGERKKLFGFTLVKPFGNGLSGSIGSSDSSLAQTTSIRIPQHQKAEVLKQEEWPCGRSSNRSRSLIRRSSRKVKEQMDSGAKNVEDCVIQ